MLNIKNLLLQIIFITILSLSIGIGFNLIRDNGISILTPYEKLEEKAICSAIDPNCIVELSLEETEKKFVENKSVFIDARDISEYNRAHIKGAKNIPYHRFDTVFFEFASTISPTSEIITYCNGLDCELAKKLAEKLLEYGYTNIKVFKDGFPAWEAKKLPIETTL
jgi:rhodanese-related sulfurtransferase